MNITQLRSQLKQDIDQLSPKSLEKISEFIANLVNQENEDATEELLKITGFPEAFERGKQQVKEGKVKDWRSIRYERDERLKAIAESAISDYSSGGSLGDLWSDDGDSDYLENYLKI